MKKIFKPNNYKTQVLTFKSQNNIFAKSKNEIFLTKIAYYKTIIEYLKKTKPIEDCNYRNMLFVLQGNYFIELEPALYSVCDTIHGNLTYIGDVYYTNDIEQYKDNEVVPLYKMSIEFLSKVINDNL